MEEGSETTSSSSSSASNSNQQPSSTSSPPKPNLKQPQVMLNCGNVTGTANSSNMECFCYDVKRIVIFNAELVPAFSGFSGFGNGDADMFPVMYPAVVGGFNPGENQQQANLGAGIYAVPVLPYTGIPSNTLIPLTYNIPT
ncbi:hypothetical protein Patl1_14166 [Pistacia atlantica]|uniref:Uncharacterized protein n=1 Tax=Pistacia atlantica TaxID=434234 RepID=A0ACC1AWH9_9ROSI|nr:hypothetical protein Patl1_14166 [Pistacia atlantica]